MITRTTGRVSSAAAAMIAAAILVAGATAPAYAADPTTTEAPAKASAKPDKDVTICVKAQSSTGTRMARKTCMTRGEWIAKTGVDPTEQK